MSNGTASRGFHVCSTPLFQFDCPWHNGCNPMSGVKALVLSSPPGVNNTVWGWVTPEGQYSVGGDDPPEGETVDNSTPVLLGPFDWVPTEEEAAHDGHRCLLAAVTADDDPIPPGSPLDVPNLNNVTQRNLTVSSCVFELPNQTSSVVEVALRVQTDVRVEDASVLELLVPFEQALLDLWSNQVGVQAVQDGPWLRVQFLVRDVTLPAFLLNPGGSLDFSFAFDLMATSGNRERFVRMYPTIDGVDVSGFTCHALAPPIIRVP